MPRPCQKWPIMSKVIISKCSFGQNQHLGQSQHLNLCEEVDVVPRPCQKWPITSNVIIQNRSFDLSSYTEVCWVIYDSGSVPRRAIFSPRETSPYGQPTLSLSCCAARLPQMHKVYKPIDRILQFYEIARGRVLQGYLAHKK